MTSKPTTYSSAWYEPDDDEFVFEITPKQKKFIRESYRDFLCEMFEELGYSYESSELEDWQRDYIEEEICECY